MSQNYSEIIVCISALYLKKLYNRKFRNDVYVVIVPDITLFTMHTEKRDSFGENRSTAQVAKYIIDRSLTYMRYEHNVLRLVNKLIIDTKTHYQS